MDKKETYADYLRSPLWQRKRLEIFERDNFTCQHCGTREKELQVHHMSYSHGTKPWEYPNDKLITLCKDCHENETQCSRELYDNFKDLKSAFTEKGLSIELLNSMLEKISECLRNEDNGYTNDVLSFLNIIHGGTQIMSDFVALKKLGVHNDEFFKIAYPNNVDSYGEQK